MIRPIRVLELLAWLMVMLSANRVVWAAAALDVPAGFSRERLPLPDVPLVDQAGKSRLFYKELVRGQTVAVAFTFTQCTAVCPMISRAFQEVQALLPDRVGRDIRLISVSVDPKNDTPARLGEYAKSVQAGAGWTFLTGKDADLGRVYKAFGQRVTAREGHTSAVYILNDRVGAWTRMELTATTPAALAKQLEQAADLGISEADAAQRFFTNLPVVDANGRALRFYRDAVEGHIVVMNSFFTRCTNSCPLITHKLVQAQALLTPAELDATRFISLSADPEFDTPERVRHFAIEHKALQSWTWLTGKKENLDWILYKLGLSNSQQAGDHSTLVLIGDARTGVWNRVSPLSTPEQIAATIASLHSEVRR
jgi:protein SCO1/2